MEVLLQIVLYLLAICHVAKKLHIRRDVNNQVATDFRLWWHVVIDEIIYKIRQLQTVLVQFQFQCFSKTTGTTIC